MMNAEIHIVIIWEKALNKFDQILYDLKNSFDVIDVIEVKWSDEYFSNNLTRFYGENLPDGSFKQRHCGTGPFIAVIIKDNNPIYEKRQTSKGVSLVNSQLFDKKDLYRKWTGGGHKVHTSNNLNESKQDIFFLFNKDFNDYINVGDWSGKIQKYTSDIEGASGWKSFNHFFKFINYSSNYIILRNYQGIDSMDPFSSDIDFLTDDNNFSYHINGLKKYNIKERSAYQITVGSQKYNVDIRLINDFYYDYKWSSDMLQKKIKYNNFFIPDSLNEFYSLLYHAIIHKNEYNGKYDDKLIYLSEKNNINIETNFYKDRNKMLCLLNSFLDKNQYKVTKPNDFSVQYNYGNKGLKRIIWEFIGKFKNG